MSQQIKRLERDVGTALLATAGRGVDQCELAGQVIDQVADVGFPARLYLRPGGQRGHARPWPTDR